MRDINDQITRDLAAHACNQVVEVLRRTGRLTTDTDSCAKLHATILLSVFAVTVGTLLVKEGKELNLSNLRDEVALACSMMTAYVMENADLVFTSAREGMTDG